MFRTKERYATLYLRFLITFLCFTLFPVIIFGLMFYVNFLRTSQQAFFEEYQSILTNLTHNSSDRFMVAESELLQLAENNAVRVFKKLQGPGGDIQNIRDLDDTLMRTKIKIPFIESIYVYDRESDTMATSVSGNYERKDFYDTQWLSRFSEGFTVLRLPQRWNIDPDLSDKEIYNSGIFMTPRRVITLAIGNDEGKIIAINIGNEALYRLLMEQYHFDDVQFMIADKEGNLFLSPSEDSILPPLSSLDFHRDFSYYTDHSLIYLVRENNNYRHVLTIPRKMLTRNTRFFLNYVVLISALLTVLGIILSFLMSNILYSPFNDLLGKIKNFAINEYKYDETKTKDELLLMRQIFGRLTEDKALLEDRVHLYEKTVRNRYFIDYIDGRFSYAQFKTLLETVNFSIKAPYFAFLILDSTSKKAGDDPSKYDRYKTIESMDTYLGKLGQGLFFDYTRDRYAAFCFARTPEEVKETIKKVYNLASEVFQISPFAAMSRIGTDKEIIPETFTHAQHAFEICRFYGIREKLVDSGEIPSRDISACPYPEALEAPLVKLLLHGEREKLEPLLTEWTSRFTDPPYGEPEAVKTHFKGLLTLLRKEFPLRERGAGLSSPMAEKADSLSSLTDSLRQLCLAILTFVEEKGSNDNYYCSQVKDYLDAHHRENINLTILSEHLNISYPYLSRVFKETTGLNILDYLNGIRIEKAKEMLRENNESLSAIAEEVGYNNIQSFQRYFRKFEKMTPGEYRTKERLGGS